VRDSTCGSLFTVYSLAMPRPFRPVPDTEKPHPGTAPPPLEHEPVERPGPDPDTDGEPVEP